jgi:spore coat protein A
MADSRKTPARPTPEPSPGPSHIERRQFITVVGGALALGVGIARSPARAGRMQSGPHHGGMARYGMKHRRHGWTSHGAKPPIPEVRTVVHVHGLKVLPESDGYPEAWFTNDFSQTGPFFDRQIYQYPNDQAATGLWYHDHALGITRLNLYTGLEGFYFVRDADEDNLNLPKEAHEIPLMIQDRLLNPDGSLEYPVSDNSDPEVPPFWVPEFFGDTVLVNGKVWPQLEVEPRKYRFRILNASNARFYHLTLNESRWDGDRLGSPGPQFIQIGSDGGFLPAPVRLRDLTIAPAERFDVIIDFADAEGKSFVLSNDAKAPFPDGDDVVPADVMLFKVTRRLSGRDTSAVPSRLPAAPALNPAAASRVRDLVLIENASAQDNPIEGLISSHWMDAVTESPRAGATEIWRSSTRPAMRTRFTSISCSSRFSIDNRSIWSSSPGAWSSRAPGFSRPRTSGARPRTWSRHSPAK